MLSSLFPWRNNRSRFYRMKNNHQVFFKILLRSGFNKNIFCTLSVFADMVRMLSAVINQDDAMRRITSLFQFMTEVFLQSRWKRRVQICLATVNLILEQIYQELTLLTPFYGFFSFTFIHIYFTLHQFCQSVVFKMIRVYFLVCIFFCVALFFY